jgi:hypothetical protein
MPFAEAFELWCLWCDQLFLIYCCRSKSVARNNQQGDIIKYVSTTSRFRNMHNSSVHGSHTCTLSHATYRFNKFLNLWMTKLFHLDWKRSATLPLFLEVMKVTMPIEEFNNVRAICARVCWFLFVLYPRYITHAYAQDVYGRRGPQVVHHSAGLTKQAEAKSPRIIMTVLGYSRPKSMGVDVVRIWRHWITLLHLPSHLTKKKLYRQKSGVT